MFFHWALLALIFFPSLFHVNIQLPLRLVMVLLETPTISPTFETLIVFSVLPLHCRCNRTNGASTRKSRCPFLSFPYKNGGIMK